MDNIGRPHGIPISPAVGSTVVRKLLRAPLSRAIPGTLTKAASATSPTLATNAAAQAAASTAAAAAASTATTTASSNVNTPPISEADFMQLLVTQLQNQDPMNPLQPDQLASELAQFTSVQQLAQLNTDAGSQLSAVNSNTQAIQANMASALLGHPVVATGGEVDVSASSSTTKVLADIGAGGGQGVLTLTNAAGQTVGTYNLGTLAGGPQQVLSFNASGVTPGAYNYSVSVTSPSGASVPVTTYIVGTVTNVDVSTAPPTLGIGDLSAPINNLVEVLPVPPAASTSPTS